MKDFEQHFPVVLFIASYKLILNMNGIECHVNLIGSLNQQQLALQLFTTKTYFNGKLPRSLRRFSDVLSLTINDKHKDREYEKIKQH